MTQVIEIVFPLIYRSVRRWVPITKETKSEIFHVRGDELLKKVKELIHQKSIRRISIKDREGKIFVEIPLTIGVVRAILAPTLASVGAIAAIVTECTITVERSA